MTSISSDVDQLNKTKVPDNHVLVNWIGQAGFIFKTVGDVVLCVDPYLSNSIEKYGALPSPNRRTWYNSFDVETFRPDVVLLTHDHLDHLDPETIPVIYAFSDPIFYGPKSCCDHLKKMKIPGENIKEIRIGQVYHIGDVTLKPVYAKHTVDSVGYLISSAGLKFYITGDTCLDEKLYDVRNDKVDILIACVNGKYGNMNVDDAITLMKRINAKVIVPMHYGLIDCNTIDVTDFIEACQKSGVKGIVLGTEKDYFAGKKESNIYMTRRTV